MPRERITRGDGSNGLRAKADQPPSHSHEHAHPHAHGLVDRSLLRSRAGLRAVAISLAVLVAGAGAQLAIFSLSHSVALLADLVHNFGDALTAVPLGIAFLLRSAIGERLAGFAVVLAIFVSACVALYAAVDRFVNPQHLRHLWVLAAAGLVGFIANELAAQVRLRAGRRLASAALLADGSHARIDGLVSLGVVVSAAAVGLGAQVADPLIGLAITLAIFRIAWSSWKTVLSAEIDLEHVDVHGPAGRSLSGRGGAAAPRATPCANVRDLGAWRKGGTMASVMLLVGTRKGLFVLTSDEARKDWRLRGPFCEGWPVFHAIFDPARETIFAAAASDWHGTTVWRSADLGESWAQSGEGLSYGEDGPKLTKASSLSLVNGSLFAGVDQPGLFESRDGGLTWSYFTGLEDQAARETWLQPNASPPGNLGIIALIPHPDNPSELLANVQGYGVFRSEDGGSSWTPWNSGFRAEWPQQDPAWGYCIHKIVTTAADTQRLFAQSHCGMFRSSDRGATWEEITEGLPGDFGFAAAAHPHDRDSAYFIPVDPGHARCTPGRLVVWRTEDAGDSWRALTRGLPQEDAYLGVLREGMSNDTLDQPGFYFGTSTGQVYASADEGETWSEIAGHLPGIASVEAVALAD